MSQHQGSLFGRETTLRDILDAEAIQPRDPSVTPVEAPRLSRQCQAILERLQRGPATNDELARISRKYTSRVSDLRAAGYRVDVETRNYATGLTTYRLV